MSNDEISINGNNIDSKEHAQVQKKLEQAVEKLKSNPDEFLKSLKPFTVE